MSLSRSVSLPLEQHPHKEETRGRSNSTLNYDAIQEGADMHYHGDHSGESAEVPQSLLRPWICALLFCVRCQEKIQSVLHRCCCFVPALSLLLCML